MNTICLRIEICNLRRDIVRWYGCWNHHLCTACPLIKITLMQNLTVTEPEAELSEDPPFPLASQTSHPGGFQTVLEAGWLYHNGLWWPPGPLRSFPMTGTPQRLCRFHHHKKAPGLPHAGLLLPDIWLAFQIFHLTLTSFLHGSSAVIIRPSSKSVKMLHWEI